MGKPLVDPSFHAMEAWKPERRVFPLEGNHMEKGSFQDGNPMEICCILVVSLMFPLKGNIFFSPSATHLSLKLGFRPFSYCFEVHLIRIITSSLLFNCFISYINKCRYRRPKLVLPRHLYKRRTRHRMFVFVFVV